MIGAFARGFRVLREPAYREAAVRSARFVRSTLSGDGGKTLFRRWRDGEARFEWQLDDYAYLAAGLLELHEATLEPDWLLWASDLARTMVNRFHDPEHGGFFDSPGSDASILARLKESYDGAEPSGHAAATGVLARLSAMTGNEEWRRTAAESLRFFGRLLDEQPHAIFRFTLNF